MKTARVILVAVLLVFTAVSISNADEFKEKPDYKLVSLTIVKAMYVPGLPQAMLQQIDEETLLGCGCLAIYTAQVISGNVIYRITGSEKQWVAFFDWGGITVGDEDVNKKQEKN